MHNFLRPDAAASLEDEGVKRALGEYVKVVKNESPARFMIARMVPVDFDGSMEEADLWSEHERAMEDFRELEIEWKDKLPTGMKKAEPNLLDLKALLAKRILSSCHFCQRSCQVDRTAGEKGFCRLNAVSRLSSEFLHVGEEACLVPSHTIFFIGCNFYCVFCQNWTISRQQEKGVPVTGADLAEVVKRRLLSEGSRNVNLVGGEPTPNTHTILDMLCRLDVNIPVVWNSNMYLHTDTLKLLDGCVDIYLTDFKYGPGDCGKRLSKVEDYWDVITRNHLLAFRQAEIIIRHLVLPNHVDCCTRPILEWIAENLGNDVRVNIMGQYHPDFRAMDYEDITRPPSQGEMERAREIAKELGLWNLD